MKKMKWMGILAALLCATLLVTGCGGDNKNENGASQDGTQQGDNQGTNNNGGNSGGDNTVDPDINLDGSLLIKLDDRNTYVRESGATYAHCVLKIT